MPMNSATPKPTSEDLLLRADPWSCHVSLDALGAKSQTADTQLEKMESRIESMGVSMSTQFSAIMKGLADLVSCKETLSSLSLEDKALSERFVTRAVV